MHRLTKAQARRVAVRAQMLDAKRPRDLVSLVRQLDLPPDRPDRGDRSQRGSRGVEPSWLVVPAENLKRELEENRTLFELDAMVRPMSDVGLYLAERGGVDGLRRAARLDDGQRQVPARHPEAAPPLGAARLARDPGHVRRALGLDRLDERPERHADARVHGCSAARSRSPDASGASGCGIWRSASIRR